MLRPHSAQAVEVFTLRYARVFCIDESLLERLLLVQHARIEQAFSGHVFCKLFRCFFELAVERYFLCIMDVRDFWWDIVISTLSARPAAVGFV